MLYMKGETKSRAYCEHCYREGMTGMKGRLCIEDSGAPRCFSRAAYALPGQKPRRCTLHKEEGMLHIHKASAKEARRRLQKGKEIVAKLLWNSQCKLFNSFGVSSTRLLRGGYGRWDKQESVQLPELNRWERAGSPKGAAWGR